MKILVCALVILQVVLMEKEKLLITAEVSGEKYTLLQNGILSEVVQIGRVEESQCHSIPHLRLNQNVQQMKLEIKNSESPLDIRGKITRNTNGALLVPNISIIQDGSPFVPEKVEAIVEFNCNGTSEEPWAFVGIEIVDAGTRTEFEVLKICDASFAKVFDWSVVALLILSLGVVILASLSLVPVSLDIKKDKNAQEETKAEMTVEMVLGFVLSASLMLLLIFYYPNIMVLVLTISISISGTFLIGVYLFQILQMSTKSCPSLRSNLLQKVLFKELTLAEIICYIATLCLFVCWLVTKNWILNNIIGIFFILCFIRVMRVKSLKVGTILLSSLFFYDIFWVFYSKPVFGSNVMVTVATQFDLPFKLLMPHFNKLPSSQCLLIGLGDLVIPGLVITFAYKATLRLRTKFYYLNSLIGYVLALICTEIALHVSNKPQPALLYISPFVLSALFLTGLRRKELKRLWKGLKKDRQNPPRRIEMISIHNPISKESL